MSSDADWQELHFTARKDQVEALEDWLFAHGALSVTLEDEADQPLLEPGTRETPLWDAVSVTALFAGALIALPVLAQDTAEKAPTPVNIDVSETSLLLRNLLKDCAKESNTEAQYKLYVRSRSVSVAANTSSSRSAS